MLSERAWFAAHTLSAPMQLPRWSLPVGWIPEKTRCCCRPAVTGAPGDLGGFTVSCTPSNANRNRTSDAQDGPLRRGELHRGMATRAARWRRGGGGGGGGGGTDQHAGEGRQAAARP